MKKKGNNILQSFNKNDFVIVIKPQMSKGEWSGEIDVNVVSSGDSELPDEDYYSLLHFTRMVCASIPLMEHNDDFREECERQVEIQMDLLAQERANKKRLTVVGKEGNVIQLNFNSDTKGSA
tara:strand:+ start:108 stop:473 length:366 start_codon:yes stop_codon:yes gene_type:complete